MRPFLLLALLMPLTAQAQEARFSFGVSTGWANLTMRAVRQDNENDLAGFIALGFPVAPFPELNPVPFVTARVAYRFSHARSVFLSVQTFDRTLEATTPAGQPHLYLQRGLGATDVMLGAAHHFPPSVGDLDVTVELAVGTTSAWVHAEAFGTTEILVGKTPQEVTIFDSQTDYTLSSPFAVAGMAAGLPLPGPFALKAAARYKTGPIAKLAGETTEDGVTTRLISEVEFDFSGLFLSLGLALEF